MRRLVLLLMVALAAAAIAGCFNPFDPRISTERVASSPAPTPSSPANTVRLFVWCWQHRDAVRYEQVFTDDYRFIFQPNDSAGNGYVGRPWLREDEIETARHLFTGGADAPPASEIQITIDKVLTTAPDSRPGREFKWHKTITTHVDLKVTVTDASGTPSVTPVTGSALFYLVRGDSANVPAGFTRDSTRWWIERWDDLTIATGGASAQPAPTPGARPAIGVPYWNPPATFGQLKVTYRSAGN